MWMPPEIPAEWILIATIAGIILIWVPVWFPYLKSNKRFFP
jgi:hypothetical protein